MIQKIQKKELSPSLALGTTIVLAGIPILMGAQNWNDHDRYFETARLLRQVITEHKKNQKNDLTAALRLAKEAGEDDKAMKIRQELNELIKEIPRAQK